MKKRGVNTTRLVRESGVAKTLSPTSAHHPYTSRKTPSGLPAISPTRGERTSGGRRG